MPQVSSGWDSRSPVAHEAPFAIWPIEQEPRVSEKRGATPANLIRPAPTAAPSLHKSGELIISDRQGVRMVAAARPAAEEPVTTIHRVL